MYYMDEGQLRVSYAYGRCPECGGPFDSSQGLSGVEGPPDERTEAGMKCGRCAYVAERERHA